MKIGNQVDFVSSHRKGRKAKTIKMVGVVSRIYEHSVCIECKGKTYVRPLYQVTCTGDGK